MKVQNKKQIISKEICPNVILKTQKMDLKETEDLAHTLYTYSVEVKEVSTVTITLDFSAGENIKIENQDDLVATATIRPMSSEVVAVVRAYDVTWSTSMRIKMKKGSPSPDEQKEFIKEHNEVLQRDINKAVQDWDMFPLKVADDEKILTQIRKNGTNFIDIDFLPTDSSINDPSQGQAFDRLVQWRRPRDFMVADPSKGVFDPAVFEKDIEASDILQGQLGDCWFLCAVSALTERPALVERLFLTKEFNDEGVYRMKFCKNGEWQEVVVDDYFPCYPLQGPMFSRAHGNELWVLLLEKAFAKLHGTYKTITGGVPSEALSDLTGCPTITFDFQDKKVKEMVSNGKLWKSLVQYDKEGFLICGGTPGQDRWTEDASKPDDKGGLVAGHAYAVIQCIEAKGNKLMQLRNPWGKFEWDGAWSDTSPQWTEDMKQQVNPILDEEDGTFWMCFEDFNRLFMQVDVCRVSNWNELRLRGRYIRYNDENDPDNEIVVSKWFYALEVPRKTHVIIGLHQEDERIEGVLPRRPYIDHGIALLKRDIVSGQTALYDFKDYVMSRETELECVLEPGSYIVVPRTTGCNVKRPLDSESEDDIIDLLQNNGQLTSLFESTVTDIFKKFDLVISNTIDFKEFSQFCAIIGLKMTEPEFKSGVLARYCSSEGGITLRGFKNWFRDQVGKIGQDAAYEWLAKLGYDKQLYSLKSRCFTVTFHSKSVEEGEGEMEVKIRDAIKTDIDNHATSLILKEHGKTVQNGEGYRIVEYVSQEIFASSWGFINEREHQFECVMDFSESENLSFSTAGPICKRKINGREAEFMMATQPGFGSFKKVWNHEAKSLAKP